MTNQVDEKIRCLFGLSEEKHSRLRYIAYVMPLRVVFPAHWTPPACRGEKTRSHRCVLSQETYQCLFMRSKSCMLRCCHDSVSRYHLGPALRNDNNYLDYLSFSSLILLICSVSILPTFHTSDSSVALPCQHEPLVNEVYTFLRV